MEHRTRAGRSEIYRGHEIHVHAERNARGAWTPDVAIFREGRRIDLPLPDPIEPDWLTEREALRDGIERGYFAIDHGKNVE